MNITNFVEKLKQIRIFFLFTLFFILLSLVGVGCEKFRSSANNQEVGDSAKAGEIISEESKSQVLKKLAEILNTPNMGISQISLLPFVIETKSVDLNDDGETEFIIAAHEDVGGIQVAVAGLFAQARGEAGGVENDFESMYSMIPEQGAYTASFVRDLNADEQKEAIFLSESCGTWGCDTNVLVIAWDGKTSRSLTNDNVAISQITSTREQDIFRNINGDHIDEILLHGGGIVSPLAGYQRAFTLVYEYDVRTQKYVEKERIYDQEDDIYFLMMDAYYALERRAYAEVISIVDLALIHPNWMPQGVYHNNNLVNLDPTKNRLYAYLTFQKVIAILALDSHNILAAENTIQSFLNSDTDNNPYASSLSSFIDTYKKNNLLDACRVYQQKVITFRESMMDTFLFSPWEEAKFLYELSPIHGPNQQEILQEKNICPLNVQ